MPSVVHSQQLNKPTSYFCLGLALVMLSLWIPYIPDWLTFIHMWRVELFSSVFLLATLVFVLIRSRKIAFPQFSEAERRYLIYPLLAFIAWSALSVFWAESWKSAVHHTLVWIEYLVFYTIVRYQLDQSGGFGRVSGVFLVTLTLYALAAVAGYVAISLYGGGNTLGIRFARFGEQVITILPLVLVGVVRLTGRKLAAGITAVVGLWLLVFCSLGRTNYFLFFCGVISAGFLIFIIKRNQRYRSRFAVVFAALSFATVFFIALPTFFAPNDSTPINRFKDEEALSSSNGFRKLMLTLSSEMFAAHPFIGVGADNFGFEVNKYRESHALAHADDPNLAQAESEIPERSHNEYMQIAAELGLVGIAIFAWFLFGIAKLGYRSLAGARKLPLQAHAAVIGIGLFLASSLLTSYSFRLIQNGFVFFFALAVAVKLLFPTEQPRDEERASISPVMLRAACAVGIIGCLLLAVYSSMRVASVIVTDRANHTRNYEKARAYYETAMLLDDENPFSRNNLGTRLFSEGRYADAVPYLKEAIDMGVATSTDFSYLASAQTLSGDNHSAEETMRRAVVLYPRSIFVRTRLAAILDENGKSEEAEANFQAAARINEKKARTWFAVITEGPRAASAKAATTAGFGSVMDLQPQTSIYAVVTERLIRFPEERKFSLVSVGLPPENRVEQ